jgi:hypothetical protein
MLELAKEVTSFGWAVSLFGAQQIGALLLRPSVDTAQKSASALASVIDVAASALESNPTSSGAGLSRH